MPAAPPPTPSSIAPRAGSPTALIAEGIGPQARVAHLDKSSDIFFELLFGAAKANAVMVSVNWRLAPPEVLHIVNDAQAEILFVGEEYFPVIEKIRDELKTVAQDRGLRRPPPATGSRSPPGATGSPPPIRSCRSGPTTRRVQFYTSGTTGLPKGAELTNANFACDAAAVDQDLAAGAGRAQSRLPADVPYRRRRLGHRRPVRRRHQPCRARVRARPRSCRLIERERLQVMLLVPAMILFLVQAPQIRETDLSSLRLIVYGAAPIPAELLKQAMAIFPCGFQQVYGLTETTGAITLLPPDDHDPADARKLLSCGYAQNGVELRIVGDDGKDLPTGQVGEIAVRSPQIMGGYWNLPDATRRAIQGDWFFTGDAGYLDDKGYLYIYDRVKDMIVSGGENIYPAEVESALFGHPAVADVAVIGVPDERWGEAVKAVVVKKPGRRRHRRRADRLGARAHRRLQAAEVGRLRRGAAAQSDRQDPEARTAQALLGRQAAPGELRA